MDQGALGTKIGIGEAESEIYALPLGEAFQKLGSYIEEGVIQDPEEICNVVYHIIDKLPNEKKGEALDMYADKYNISSDSISLL